MRKQVFFIAETAGKSSEPDYEMLIDEGCGLAIESTMIYHTPEVQEMIEERGIPVLVDRSSYESNPLGRMEWIKFYAEMIGKEDEAKAFFDEQKAKIEGLEDFENTEKTVAFFYISTDGKAMVRKGTDYIPAMIEMAGGAMYQRTDIAGDMIMDFHTLFTSDDPEAELTYITKLK